MKEKILISACLLGQKCRYDGKEKGIKELLKLTKYFDLIPVCPEVLGGLKIPRYPSEILNDRVINQKGVDVTENYNNGAYWVFSVAKQMNIKMAILKENSPSCGVHKVHNGKFDGGLIEGSGITTKKLLSIGVKVLNEEEALKMLEDLEVK